MTEQKIPHEICRSTASDRGEKLFTNQVVRSSRPVSQQRSFQKISEKIFALGKTEQIGLYDGKNTGSEMSKLEKKLTVRDVAESWGVSDQTVYNEVKSGRLKCLRLGIRLIRFTQEQISAYEAANEQEGEKSSCIDKNLKAQTPASSSTKMATGTSTGQNKTAMEQRVLRGKRRGRKIAA